MTDPEQGPERAAPESEVPEQPEAVEEQIEHVAERPPIPIPDEIVEIVREAGDDPEKMRTVLEMVAWSWQGPLPHPNALAAFNNAYEGCARDIVEMTKSQSQHRQNIETKVVDADIKLRRQGQHYAFIIAMGVIVGGFIVIGIGRPLTGFAAVLVGLASLVALFLYSRHRQDDELAAKRHALEQSIASDENGQDGRGE